MAHRQPVSLKGNQDIDERTQKVLYGIIDNYIQSYEPVGSRTLSKALDIELSPATIRNIMADLSEMGFLMQTHTSAGRIPTDKAFRFYVDQLAVSNTLPSTIQNKIDLLSLQGIDKVENLLYNTTRLLADLTKFVCVISAPRADVSVLQRIEFIKVSAHKILVILITKSGLIRNKMIESKEELSQDFLNSVSQFLNDQFKDDSLQEIRNRIMQSMVEDKERYDKLLAQAVRLGKKAFELEDRPEFFLQGQFNLLLNERFKEQERIRNLMDAFETKSLVMELLDSTMLAGGLKIYIGMENTLEELKDCSLVTAGYGDENHLLGMVGVIGPTSMDYQHIIPVVDYTAKILSQSMSVLSGDDD